VLDLPNQPIIDKHALVGGCVRLPISVDAGRLSSEVAALPQSLWGTTAGRVGVHSAADAVFLRGYAPAQGDKPIEDRPALQQLPYIRSILEELIPAPPLRALLARLPAAALIRPHVDSPPYFSKTLRIHVPVETNDKVVMISAGQVYRMLPGEIWVLNNGATHAVMNRHPSRSRTHLICDFLPTDGLLALLASGERNLGVPFEQAEAGRRNPAAR
jgi:hypothetical protein